MVYLKCPKCNLKISSKEKKCPFCETKISKVEDTIDELPDISKEPKKITQEENLEKTKRIRIKPIPLAVKKVTKAKEKDDYSPTIEIPKLKIEAAKKEEKEKKFVFFSNIKVIAVILILVLNLILIIKTVVDLENKPKEEVITTSKSIVKTTSNEVGNWRSSNNGLFLFQDDKTFYWFDSYLNQADNYYSGTYNYKKGQEALIEMGYTEEEIYKTFGSDIKIENIYSMNLTPSFVFKAGEDVTERELKENESWWYILIVKDNNKAQAYNKTLDLRYSLIKS